MLGLLKKWFGKTKESDAQAKAQDELRYDLFTQALEKDGGAVFVDIMEKYFGGAKGLSEIELTWLSDEFGQQLFQQAGFKESLETDVWTILISNKRFDCFKHVVEKGWYTGEEWFWLKGVENENQNAVAHPIKSYVQGLKHGHNFIMSGGEPLMRVWGLTGENQEEWLLEQVLNSTKSWGETTSKTQPRANNKQLGLMRGTQVHEMVLATYVAMGAITERHILNVHDRIVREYSHLEIASPSKPITRWITDEFISYCQSKVLKTSLPDLVPNQIKKRVL